ncbi:MAG: hypothetical protein ACRCXZ_10960 [Patescibacteria group bacterium]
MFKFNKFNPILILPFLIITYFGFNQIFEKESFQELIFGLGANGFLTNLRITESHSFLLQIINNLIPLNNFTIRIFELAFLLLTMFFVVQLYMNLTNNRTVIGISSIFCACLFIYFRSSLQSNSNNVILLIVFISFYLATLEYSRLQIISSFFINLLGLLFSPVFALLYIFTTIWRFFYIEKSGLQKSVMFIGPLFLLFVLFFRYSSLSLLFPGNNFFDFYYPQQLNQPPLNTILTNIISISSILMIIYGVIFEFSINRGRILFLVVFSLLTCNLLYFLTSNSVYLVATVPAISLILALGLQSLFIKSKELSSILVVGTIVPILLLSSFLFVNKPHPEFLSSDITKINNNYLFVHDSPEDTLPVFAYHNLQNIKEQNRFFKNKVLKKRDYFKSFSNKYKLKEGLLNDFDILKESTEFNFVYTKQDPDSRELILASNYCSNQVKEYEFFVIETYKKCEI